MPNFLSLRTFENIERDDKNSLCLTLINIGDKLKLNEMLNKAFLFLSAGYGILWCRLNYRFSKE